MDNSKLSLISRKWFFDYRSINDITLGYNVLHNANASSKLCAYIRLSRFIDASDASSSDYIRSVFMHHTRWLTSKKIIEGLRIESGFQTKWRHQNVRFAHFTGKHPSWVFLSRRCRRAFPVTAPSSPRRKFVNAVPLWLGRPCEVKRPQPSLPWRKVPFPYVLKIAIFWNF